VTTHFTNKLAGPMQSLLRSRLIRFLTICPYGPCGAHETLEQSSFPDNCREQGWVLKNSLPGNPQKSDRVGKLYERFFHIAKAFSVTQISAFFRKNEFFNTHRVSHHLIT
jgi:hypothetical protein